MLNPREMEKIMRQMKTEEIEAEEVVIKTRDGELVVERPKIVKMSIAGQDMLQVSGKISKRGKGFSGEDVALVAQQAGVGEVEAKAALEKTGDIAEAIISLKT